MLRMNYKSFAKTTDADLHFVMKCRQLSAIRPQGSQNTYCGTSRGRYKTNGRFLGGFKGNVHGWRVAYSIKRVRTHFVTSEIHVTY